jgi:predicted RNA binding protein YcfA (HicA-like mRNA interferase family)
VSPALPSLTAREIVRALERAGFVHVSTKGSHAKLVDQDGHTVVVPLHGGRDVPRGTVGSILRQAGLTAATFRELL